MDRLKNFLGAVMIFQKVLLFDMRFFQIAPLLFALAFFFVGPILVILVVSFWDYTEFSLVPDFVLTNYLELFESSVTYTIYLKTIKFAGLTWIFTVVIGFWVAYFLAFQVKQLPEYYPFLKHDQNF